MSGFLSSISPNPTFSYGIPPQGLPGDVTETPEPTLDSAICADIVGLNAGAIAVTIAFQSGGVGITTPRSVARPVDTTKKIAGIVRRVSGFPRDFDSVTDFDTNQAISLVRKGHVWITCETAIADPTVATDLFFVRFAASVGFPARNVLGILRYGDNDPTGTASAATCMAIPAGMIRPVQAVAAGAVGLFEIDFTHSVATA